MPLKKFWRPFNTKSFKSDRKIIKTVIDVVHSNAEDGNCIIVGRAGHVIAKDIDNSIHIRLFAPLGRIGLNRLC